jgi:hypothetical protein
MPSGYSCVVSCSSQLFDIFGHIAPRAMRCFWRDQYSFCVAGDMAARFDRTNSTVMIVAPNVIAASVTAPPATSMAYGLSTAETLE